MENSSLTLPSAASFSRHPATFWQRLVFLRKLSGCANAEPAGAGDAEAVDLYWKRGIEGILKLVWACGGLAAAWRERARVSGGVVGGGWEAFVEG